jgi:hypothetical protein
VEKDRTGDEKAAAEITISYVSVAKDEPFERHFLEMAGLSLSVAGLSFLVSFVLRAFFDVEA